MLPPTLREALPDDTPHILDLIRELVAMDDPGAVPALREPDVLRFAAQPGNVILLAESNGQVAALLSYTVSFDLWHAGECCLIRELIVSAAYRRQGLGGLLLKEVLRRAAVRGWREVSVSAASDNLDALAFYRRHGLTDEAVLLERHS